MSKLKRFLAVFLAAAMTLSGASYADDAVPAETAETGTDAVAPISNNYYYTPIARLTNKGNGKMSIYFSITARYKMKKLGATSVNIYKDGKFYTYFFYTLSGWEDIMAYNTTSMSFTKSYTGSTGASYYVVMAAFAYNGSSEKSERAITNTIKT